MNFLDTENYNELTDLEKGQFVYLLFIQQIIIRQLVGTEQPQTKLQIAEVLAKEIYIGDINFKIRTWQNFLSKEKQEKQIKKFKNLTEFSYKQTKSKAIQLYLDIPFTNLKDRGDCNKIIDDFIRKSWEDQENKVLLKKDYPKILVFINDNESFFEFKDTQNQIERTTNLKDIALTSIMPNTITALFNSLEDCFESDLGSFADATYITYYCFTYGNNNSSGIGTTITKVKVDGTTTIVYLRELGKVEGTNYAKCFRRKNADIIYMFEWSVDKENRPYRFTGLSVIDFSPLKDGKDGNTIFRGVISGSHQNRHRSFGGRLYFIQTTDKNPKPKDYIGEQVLELKKKHPEIIDFFLNDTNIDMESTKFFHNLNLIQCQEVITPKALGLWYTCFSAIDRDLTEEIVICPIWFHKNGRVELKGKKHTYYGTLLQNKELWVIGFTERVEFNTQEKENFTGFLMYLQDHKNNSFTVYSGGHLFEGMRTSQLTAGREILIQKLESKETYRDFSMMLCRCANMDNLADLEKLNQEFRNVAKLLIQEKNHIVIDSKIFDEKQRASNNPFVKQTEYAEELFFAACGQAKYNSTKALEKLQKAFVAGFDNKELLKEELKYNLSVLEEHIDVDKLNIK